MTFRLIIPMFLLFINLTTVMHASTLYTEDFTGDGDVSLIGWTGVYDDGGSNGGLADTFAWVWNNGVCENLIYTNEYTIETSSNASIEIRYDLRKYLDYPSTPETSITVQVGGNWYVSKMVFTTSSGSFITQSLVYDPAKENWDLLDAESVSRGLMPGADLVGNITGFGLYSNSQNLGGSCTAEYDNFTVISTERIRTPDFNGSGVVDIRDYIDIANAWISSEGQNHFNEMCDLDFDMNVSMNDLFIFAQNWLAGAVYSYVPQESQRKKLSFNVGWKFYRGDIPGDAAKNIFFDDASWQNVNIPHAPVITPLRVQWPGAGTEEVNWYRKHFTLDGANQDKKVFIEFEGADNVTDVWVNGTLLGVHYGAYLPFSVDITDYVFFGGDDNVIAAKVDETQSDDIPGYGQWVSTGGFYRDIWMHVMNKMHVTDAVYANIVAGGGTFITFPQVNSAQATVQIQTHIKNEDSSTANCKLESYVVDVNGLVVAEGVDKQTIAATGDHTFTQQVTVIAPKLWHPNQPYLYTLYLHVYKDEQIVDIYQTNFGVRRIGFSLSEGFTINGQPFRFRGANRTQDYPYLGWAMGNLGQYRDAKLLKEAGFDYIRTSHYPPDPAFLDACDELGILVMDEIPGFQYVGGDLFKKRSYQNMRDMIRRDRNHPCVIAWELSLNETNFDTTYSQTAIAIGHAEYPGDQCYVAAWKYDSIYDIYIATPNAGARTYSGSTPMIVSEHGHWEYGGSSSTSDVHRATDILVDPYPGGEGPMLQQAWNHQESHHLNRGMSNMCGDGLWVGIDYGAWPSGVYDFLRLPKFSAFFWKSQRNPDQDLSYFNMDSGPMVFIANYWTESSSTDVKVYSNCDQVKLYINNVLQDTRSPDTDYPTSNLENPPFTFENLIFQPGELKAEGLIGGHVAASFTVQTPESPSSINLECTETNVPSNGSETIFVYAHIRDDNDTIVPDASKTITFSVTGPASLVTPPTVTAEAGIATALIRVTDQPGTITVNAISSGLTAGNASITSQ